MIIQNQKNDIGVERRTVTIGIPAYNEEANIKNLLYAILNQKQDDFDLLQIIVVSDGSSDNTVKEAESVSSEKISIINRLERKGKTESQNEILTLFRGDILVLLDADVIPKDEMFLSNLIKPFSIDSRIGLVGGKVSPLPSENFFEKVLNFSVAMKEEIVGSVNLGDNLYLCHGCNRAFSKDFAKRLKWPKIYGEDGYSYLMCKEKGFEFHYEPKAEVLYRSPQMFKDHLKQSVRFAHSDNILKNFFPKSVIKKGYSIPKIIIFKKGIKYFFKNPFLFVSYFFIYVSARAFSKIGNRTSALWEISKSSKSLIK